jgi:hypothetical protein
MAGILWAAHSRQFIDYSSWPENFRVNTWMSWQDAAWNSAWRAGVFLFVIISLAGSSGNGARAALLGVAALFGLAFDARTHAPRQNPTIPAAEMLGSAWNSSSRRGQNRHC